MKNFESRVDGLRKKFEGALAGVKDERKLEDLRNEFLSRKRGHITQLLDELKSLSAEEKRFAGKLINDLKLYVQDQLRSTTVVPAPIRRKLELKSPRIITDQAGEFDLTLPGEKLPWGAPHPLTLFQEEIENIFLAMGFSIAEGPEIETDYYNFEALNFPPHHPPRAC